MAGQQGKCSNFGNCSKADTGETIAIPSSGVQPVCPECGFPLMVLGGAISTKMILGLSGTALSIAGLTYALFSGSPEQTPVIKPQQPQVTAITEPQPENKPQTLPNIPDNSKPSLPHVQDEKNTDLEQLLTYLNTFQRSLDSASQAYDAAKELKSTHPKQWEEHIENARSNYEKIIHLPSDLQCKNLSQESNQLQSVRKEIVETQARAYVGLAAVWNEYNDNKKIKEYLENARACIKHIEANAYTRRAVYQNWFAFALRGDDDVEIMEALNAFANPDIIKIFIERNEDFCANIKQDIDNNHIKTKNPRLFDKIRRNIQQVKGISCSELNS